jgi:hypothetical protein
MPTINQKVCICGVKYGTITRVYAPDESEGFSGRFVVYTPKNKMNNYFWFSDYGTAVVPCK